MKIRKHFVIKDLIVSNRSVDPNVVAEARAAIKALRKHGFGNKGYSLVDRRVRSPLKRQDSPENFLATRQFSS